MSGRLALGSPDIAFISPDIAFISWQSKSGRHGGSQLAMRCSRDYNETHWKTQTFGEISDEIVTECRPLTVIDPEDAEQVKRFADVYAVPQGLPEAGPAITAAMTAALREFAAPTPPRPDEPTGKYAAVVDSAGMEWLRDGLEEESDGPWWCVDRAQQSSPGPRRAGWSDIAAVRVISEGVVTA